MTIDRPTCDDCGRPFTDAEWTDRHTGHDDDCTLETTGICRCDHNVHAECCGCDLPPMLAEQDRWTRPPC